MGKYRNIPVEVDAIQWTGDNLKEVFTLTGRIKQDMPHGEIGIFSPGESVYRTCVSGGWVVRFSDGAVKPMSAAEFAASYAPAMETA